MQTSAKCISPPLVKSTDTIISEYETVIRSKNTHNIKLENQISHLSNEYKVAHSLIDKQYAKIRSLKQEISDLQANDTVGGDSQEGVNWWSGVNLDHVEIAAWKESDKKLRKQIKYLEFLNNLLKRKLSFRDGTLEMIQESIDGNTQVHHKDGDKTYYEDPNEMVYSNNVDGSSTNNVSETINQVEKNFDQVLHNWTNSSLPHKNTPMNSMDEIAPSSNTDAIHSVGDDIMNNTYDDIASYPGYVENTQSIVDMIDQSESEASFKTVFPRSSEHIFRNCCLKVVYGQTTSYNLWEEHNTMYDIYYWQSYSVDQSAMILNSLYSNYNNDYPDLHDTITKWSSIFEHHLKKSNIILCKIVEWLFG